MKIYEYLGYIGLICLQGAFLPVLINTMLYNVAVEIPIYYLFFICIGLLFFFIRSLAQQDLLYTISNGLGFIGQLLLLIIKIVR